MSKLGEVVLRKLSRDPNAPDMVNDNYTRKHSDINHYVSEIKKTFPNISNLISNRRILDIGCSEGYESLALSMLGAEEVHGIDIRIDQEISQEILKNNPNKGLSLSVMDATRTTYPDNFFDGVVTCGSLEHFADPKAVLREAYRVLRKDGFMFITSGVWSNPWGAHMNFFTSVPWVQFLFSEETIMNVRRLYRNDGATRFHEVEGGLNKIGIRSFKNMAYDLGFRTLRLELKPLRNLHSLTGIPFINEFVTYLIVAMLKK